AGAILNGPRQKVRAKQREGDQDEEDEVRQEAWPPADLDEGRRDEDPEADARSCRRAVRERDADRVAARMKVEQGCARRAEGQAGREALQPAGDGEPRGRGGE